MTVVSRRPTRSRTTSSSRANASALAVTSSSPAPTTARSRSLDTTASGGKCAAAQVDFPEAPGPTSTTRHGAGRWTASVTGSAHDPGGDGGAQLDGPADGAEPVVRPAYGLGQQLPGGVPTRPVRERDPEGDGQVLQPVAPSSRTFSASTCTSNASGSARRDVSVATSMAVHAPIAASSSSVGVNVSPVPSPTVSVPPRTLPAVKTPSGWRDTVTRRCVGAAMARGCQTGASRWPRFPWPSVLSAAWTCWLGTTSPCPAVRTARRCSSPTASAATRTCGASWRPAFEDEYRIVLFDHVGAGGSDPSAYDRDRVRARCTATPTTCSRSAASSTCTDVVFVGHSVSAMIGVLAAHRGAGAVRPRWSWSARRRATSTTATTSAASAARTSTACSSRSTATTSAGRARWRR